VEDTQTHTGTPQSASKHSVTMLKHIISHQDGIQTRGTQQSFIHFSCHIIWALSEPTVANVLFSETL